MDDHGMSSIVAYVMKSWMKGINWCHEVLKDKKKSLEQLQITMQQKMCLPHTTGIAHAHKGRRWPWELLTRWSREKEIWFVFFRGNTLFGSLCWPILQWIRVCQKIVYLQMHRILYNTILIMFPNIFSQTLFLMPSRCEMHPCFFLKFAYSLVLPPTASWQQSLRRYMLQQQQEAAKSEERWGQTYMGLSQGIP